MTALLLLLILGGPAALCSEAAAFRPPCVPLVACDPYFSIWSPADKLNAANTVHWTGKAHRLTCLARIDGKVFRLMGAEPTEVLPLEQTGLEVTPTSTIYHFAGAGVELGMMFTTPALPQDVEILSSPITYVLWGGKATDGQVHDISIYFDAAAEIVVNEPSQEVGWAKERITGIAGQGGSKARFKTWRPRNAPRMGLGGNIRELMVLKMGSKDQPVLAKRGDDLRIDWGYLYVAAPAEPGTSQTVGSAESCRGSFSTSGTLPMQLDTRQPRGAKDETPVAATVYELGKVGASGAKRRILILAYDDLYSIQYMKQNLRPYWRRNGWQAADLLRAAALDYEDIIIRSASLDQELMQALTRAGGEKYASICALAYRQCFAANKIAADAKGQPLMFPKENFSNGCIGTVDVIYPMAPQFLLFGPSLSKAMLAPILDYAASPRWRWPFAPHDLGQYPMANGQVYGGGERTEENQMPVEETGNMLILLAALAQVEGNADFSAKYWPVLLRWADYLKAKGFDPENQLCTDDFAGHLAHNVNLSAKAICGLGAFAQLCERRGDKAKANELHGLAKEFASRWVKEADDGDHFRLAFDKSGTWSQKYNLVWDRILGLKLFPDSVIRKEMDYYKTKQNPFGLPLDNRKEYTKLDWTLWTATLTQDRTDFEALVSPVFRFLNETPDRVPMTDWYWTQNAKMTGFRARSVVGGIFLQMLYDRGTWSQWAKRDLTKASGWATFPKPPLIAVVVPASDQNAVPWSYTTTAPGDGWEKPEYDASAWKQAPGGFGTAGTPGSRVRTTWNSSEIWLRRDFTLPDGKWADPQLWVHHDEDAEIYINGVLAAKLPGYSTEYETVPMRTRAQQALKPGRNVMAVRCKQTGGGQYIDVGLVELRPAK